MLIQPWGSRISPWLSVTLQQRSLSHATQLKTIEEMSGIESRLLSFLTKHTYVYGKKSP